MAQEIMLEKQLNSSEGQAILLAKEKPSSNKIVRENSAARLKYLRELTRLSRQQFAKYYDIPYGSLQNWEDPKYGGLTKTGAPRVVAELKKEGIITTTDWLLYGRGPAPTISVLTVLKRMQIKRESANAQLSFANENLFINEELGLFKHHYQDNTLDAELLDNSMAPMFEKGDRVAGKKYTGNQINQLIGKICIVTTENKQVMVRKIMTAGKQPNLYSLVCTNAAFKSATMENVTIVSAAPVIWMRKPLDQ